MRLRVEMVGGPSDAAGRPLFRLLEPYTVTVGMWEITVPAGYVTNFGTVPRIFQRLVGSHEMREAAVVHDWLCGEDLVDDDYDEKPKCSRWLADAILLDLMRNFNIADPTRRTLVWLGVRSYAIATGRK